MGDNGERGRGRDGGDPGFKSAICSDFRKERELNSEAADGLRWGVLHRMKFHLVGEPSEPGCPGRQVGVVEMGSAMQAMKHAVRSRILCTDTHYTR